MRWQWTKCVIALVLYAAFLIWIGSWWGVIVIPFIFDAYITRKINWGWWRDLENSFLVTLMSWVDAIVFALVAVYFVNIYFFQNYTIPSPSLEKSLLVGDYLFVSKMSYGPRKPMTPLTMPLTQHTMPMGLGKSYIEWPQWEYERVSPSPVKRGDIVVFNFPAGDTIPSSIEYQNPDFYSLCQELGRTEFMRQKGAELPIDQLNAHERRMAFQLYHEVGRQIIEGNPGVYGKIDWRPVDRRENYVKRCVGLPGDTLKIFAGTVYINGKATKEPENAQHNYIVKLTSRFMPDSMAQRLSISNSDLNMLYSYGLLPLTRKKYEALRHHPMVEEITYNIHHDDRNTYPLNGNRHWTVDNYGPIWIPKKGATVKLDLDNLPLYERCIVAYEGNTLEVNDIGDIIINGKKADSYTFRMDYYWMMGDNRHNSADSRYWGFVPEDHVVGKPIMIWLSLDPDRALFTGGIRWERMFRWVESFD